MKIKKLNLEKRGAHQHVAREAQLLAYCAMAGSALMAAHSADAAIVYSGLQNLPLDNNTATVLIDLDGNLVNDFQFKNVAISSSVYFNAVKPLAGNALGANPFYNLPVTQIVNAALSWKTQGAFTNTNGLILNLASAAASIATVPFDNGAGYLGMRFQIDSNTHYGWIRYDGTTSKTGGLVATGVIVEWAYEDTPDASIYVSSGIDDYKDNCSAAFPVGLNSTVSGVINYAGDNDTFKIEVTGNGTLDVYTTGTTDTYGYLLNSTCDILIQNDDKNNDPGLINFFISQAVTPGTYYVSVAGNAVIGPYLLHVDFTAASTTTTTTIPPTTTTTSITPCSLTVTPGKISKLFSVIAPIRRIIIRSQAGAALPDNPDIDWGTDAIRTLSARLKNDNTIIAWVFIRPLLLKANETYDIAVGDCTGEITTKPF